MASKNLDKFEEEAEKELKRVGEEVPVLEARILSPDVLRILMVNARNHGNVTYDSSGHKYEVSYGFAEVHEDDGNLGVYDDLPEDLSPEDAETVAFMVKGLHFSKETEVQFSEGKMLLNAHRELRHVVEFQRAVLSKGTF